MINMNEELIKQAKAVNSSEELMHLAKENNMELTEEEAATYFAQLNCGSGELDDDELDSVSGGGCHNGDGRMITTIANICNYYTCERCGRTGVSNIESEKTGNMLNVCSNCRLSASCNSCKLCSYEKGLWLCNSPENRK